MGNSGERTGALSRPRSTQACSSFGSVETWRAKLLFAIEMPVLDVLTGNASAPTRQARTRHLSTRIGALLHTRYNAQSRRGKRRSR